MEKYRSVIHSKTGNNITAFILENDATWVGREKEIFHATPLYCEDGQIIEMIFVKTYIKKNKTVVYAYFRKKAGEQELKINISGESKAHKVAKENIYEGICSGKIVISPSIVIKLTWSISSEKTSRSGVIILNFNFFIVFI